MVYENPYCRKVKGSFILLVSCGYCKADIAIYQKVGKGGLLRMYIDRIVKSSIDLSTRPNALFCPHCQKQLAVKVTLRRKNKEAYRMIRSAFNSRVL